MFNTVLLCLYGCLACTKYYVSIHWMGIIKVKKIIFWNKCQNTVMIVFLPFLSLYVFPLCIFKVCCKMLSSFHLILLQLKHSWPTLCIFYRYSQILEDIFLYLSELIPFRAWRCAMYMWKIRKGDLDENEWFNYSVLLVVLNAPLHDWFAC